jgi:putative 2OG-Fe(II) oxygenase
MIDGYSKSPTLDQMFETFLTSELTKPVIEALAGKNIKLRGYNIRRMTGAYNPAPAHEWHRDSLGEFGFGILLTDIEPDDNGATAFVPGSHLYPYCPRWNNLFYVPRFIIPFLVKIAPINKILGKKVLRNHTAAWGKKGDAYIFINDTWHGRQPNLHGKEAMVVLIGAYPTDYDFPDNVTPPCKDILSKLPPNVAAVAGCQLPLNEMRDTILRRIIKNRISIGNFTLWRAAQIERKAINLLSKPYEFWIRFIVTPFNIGIYLLKRIYILFRDRAKT